MTSPVTIVGAGLGGVARAAGGAARSRMSSTFGLGEAAESGRQAAWNAMNGNAANGSTPAEVGGSMPGWARAMKSQVAARQHGQAAIHTIQQGDRGGHGANPNIKERED